MIDLLLNIDQVTLDELDKQLREICGIFLPATQEDIKEWPYKSSLVISPSCLIGHSLLREGVVIGNIESFKYIIDRGKKQIKLLVHGEEYPLTGSKIEYFNELYGKLFRHGLHPSRDGKFFWEHGFSMKMQDYKKLYYRTKTYRDMYETSLNERYGTKRLRAPLQVESVKKQASETMVEKYGAPWFTHRGKHYSAITDSMILKYGVENIFHSDEVQHQIQSNFGNGVSLKEQAVVSFLVEDLGLRNSLYFNGNKNRQATIADAEKKKVYQVDFLNEENGLIVEFNGDYWHCNPEKFDADYFHPHKELTAKQIWDNDEERRKRIETITGMKVIIVWERDWDRNQEDVKESLKTILNENS